MKVEHPGGMPLLLNMPHADHGAPILVRPVTCTAIVC